MLITIDDIRATLIRRIDYVYSMHDIRTLESNMIGFFEANEILELTEPKRILLFNRGKPGIGNYVRAKLDDFGQPVNRVFPVNDKRFKEDKVIINKTSRNHDENYEIRMKEFMHY